jgi:hypothetical protein
MRVYFNADGAEGSAVAVAEAPVASKPRKKAVAKAKGKPAKKKASAKKASTPRGVSVRERALRAIAKGGTMSASEVQEKIGLGHGLKPTLDQEVERGHLKATLGEEGRGHAYAITAAGKKALENGTVNPKREAKAGKKVAKKKAAKK